MLGQRRPGLVAIDDVVIAIAYRLVRTEARSEPGPARIALAPPVVAGQNPGKNFSFCASLP
jgi:hypothetical protein